MPKTPVRAVRIANDLWERVKAEAKRRGVTASDLIRTALEKELK